MAKWSGNIGFIESVETSRPSIYKEKVSLKKYRGDLIKNRRKILFNSQTSNAQDVTISTTSISLVADPYAIENCYTIRFVEFGGHRWSVTDVDISTRPRMVLTLGGLYNG